MINFYQYIFKITLFIFLINQELLKKIGNTKMIYFQYFFWHIFIYVPKFYTYKKWDVFLTIFKMVHIIYNFWWKIQKRP